MLTKEEEEINELNKIQQMYGPINVSGSQTIEGVGKERKGSRILKGIHGRNR